MTPTQQLQASVILTQLIKTKKTAEEVLWDAMQQLFSWGLTVQDVIDCFASLKKLFKIDAATSIVDSITIIMQQIKVAISSRTRLITTIARVFLRALSFIIPGAAQWFTLADQIAGTYEEMYGGGE